MAGRQRCCFLCGANGSGDPIDKHHIFGGAYRNKSEKLGMYVYLCHSKCHIFGRKAAHNCRKTMDELHRYGQKTAMEKYGWDIADFIREFGRNYMDEETAETTVENTFEILDEELDMAW